MYVLISIQLVVYARYGHFVVWEAVIQCQEAIDEGIESALQEQHSTRSSCAGWSDRYAGGCFPVVFIFGTIQPTPFFFFGVVLKFSAQLLNKS